MNTNFVVEMHIGMGTPETSVVSRVTAESPERAVALVRIQARPFAAAVPGDAPIWEWIELGHQQAIGELGAGAAVAVGFDIGENHLEWRVQPVLAAQAEPTN
ncbi:hypothetical protein [Streptacidiphilus carbonis]|uniref:hypothetical protein n=1 Tax=Streptacidiphilus carbonis TaxID=105422 RepID=UPI0005A8AF4D|nr:hypothetical protein [Streptacidiphilus carbonis]